MNEYGGRVRVPLVSLIYLKVAFQQQFGFPKKHDSEELSNTMPFTNYINLNYNTMAIIPIHPCISWHA